MNMAAMPDGMLTNAQMKDSTLPGPRVQPAVLTFMIQHHRGAVSMVKELFDTRAGQDDRLQVRGQRQRGYKTTEIARMEKMCISMTLGVRDAIALPPLPSAPLGGAMGPSSSNSFRIESALVTLTSSSAWRR